MLLLINTSISFLIKIFNHIVNIISHMYGRYVHQCFLNPSFTSCKYLVVVLLILALSIIYNTIQSTDSLKDKNDKNCPYQNSNQLSIECKSRFKLPVRNFVCKLHKFFFGKECRSYLEQKLIYDKDIHDYENEEYDKININTLKQNTSAYDNSNWNEPYRSDTDIFGFKVKTL